MFCVLQMSVRTLVFGVVGRGNINTVGYNAVLQTGSGKTYTMMGEITQLECKFSEDCGITPRIFQHLFSRIRMVCKQ